MEIRLHGRGGQGGVTGAKILAAVYGRMGKSVQTFGDYAAERSGAPIRAYTRVSDGPITNRNKVYEPDHLVVLDPTLLETPIDEGFKPGGTLLINSAASPEAFAERFPGHRIATVDASAIAARHGIGTRSVVIVNTTIAGAWAKAMDLPLEELEAAYAQLGLSGNFPAAREAWEAVQVRELAGPAPVAGRTSSQVPARAEIMDLVTHTVGHAPGLKTGTWRSLMPRYAPAVAPCTTRCPAGNDVEGFVQALSRHGEAAAAEVLAATTPFASVCGRVCPGFCAGGCNRESMDGAVDTRGIERWIGDHEVIARRDPAARAEPRHRVAVVGSGPAGLSAAYQIARRGDAVTLFESEAALGGVLRTGIPAFRLPRDVLDREIDAVLELGVEVRPGQAMDQAGVASLAETYDAVILATGLQRVRGLEVPGSTLPQVEEGIAFLHRVNHGQQARLSGHVVVLGGGNTAMDCARAALRLGADEVTVAYRRTEAEMPAIPEEIEEAREEGIRFAFQRAPVAFHGADALEAVELAVVEMGPPDASGRRRPQVTDQTEQLAADHVLLALGQSADHALLPEGWELFGGRAHAEGAALNVFATGDLATNEGTVAHAIGDGRRIALEALRSLGDEVPAFALPDPGAAVPPERVRTWHFEGKAPGAHPRAEAATRIRSFDEIDAGLTDGRAEAQRCFSCGDCTECDTCLVYCPEGSIHRTEGGYVIDYDYCKGCGVCVFECPRGAMEMVTP